MGTQNPNTMAAAFSCRWHTIQNPSVPENASDMEKEVKPWCTLLDLCMTLVITLKLTGTLFSDTGISTMEVVLCLLAAAAEFSSGASSLIHKSNQSRGDSLKMCLGDGS